MNIPLSLLIESLYCLQAAKDSTPPDLYVRMIYVIADLRKIVTQITDSQQVEVAA